MKTIIAMAREAGFEVDEDIANVWVSDGYIGDQLERFAELVRADEREACAQLVETQNAYGDPVTGWFDILATAIRARGNT